MKDIKEIYGGAATYKSTSTNTLLNFLELPMESKNWLITKFSDENGSIDAFALSEYIKKMRLKTNDWNIKLLEARHSPKSQIKLLTKIVIEFDYAEDLICFRLPEYGFPTKRKEAQADWSIISENKEYLLKSEGAWGEITLDYNCGIIQLTDFKPLCPYTYDLNSYREKRKNFTTEEWIDVLLAGLNFNGKNMTREEKLTLLQRFLPFVEKRLNTIELAIKGSAKSYCYSQLSSYNWLVGGGSVSRATAFFNNTTKKPGYFSKHSQVIFDEVQTIRCQAPEEMCGALKTYLESGEIRIGNYSGVADAGLSLIGNVPIGSMDVKKSNMLKFLPNWLKESALIDRFTFLIEGKKIGRFTEDRKMEGWALSTDYLTGILHQLRDEFYYRAIIDELLYVDGKCDVRNFEAVKKNATAFLKLLFPHITNIKEINIKDFKEYCLKPAIEGRENILSQLRIIDEEYMNVKMPIIKVKGE